MQVSANIVLILDAANASAWQVAQQLAAAGATLVLHDEADIDTLKTYARNLHNQGHSPLPIVAELGNEKQREALFERIYKIYGRLDILVQMPLPNSSFLDLSPHKFKQELSALSTRLHGLRTAAAEIAEGGGGKLLFLAEPDEDAYDAYLESAYRRYGEGIGAELEAQNVSFRSLSLAQLSLELSTEPNLELTAPPQVQPSRVRRWFGPKRKRTARVTQRLKKSS